MRGGASRGRGRVRAPDVPVLSASEVGTYVFCPQAWYLQRHHVARAPQALRRLKAGETAHREIGASLEQVRWLERLRTIVLGLVVLLAALVVLSWLGWTGGQP
jgi:CRISPR/Cas system-associated exonuclease Cas4 (RecB family)